jgi:hypothetical protein
VAGFAGRSSRYVSSRLTKDTQRRTVVTGRAARRDTGVIKHSRAFERDCAVVTSFARGRRNNVAHGLANRQGPVVTGRAANGDPNVVHRRARSPGRKVARDVTRLARQVRDDMLGIRRLALSHRSVVTGRTTRSNANVVHQRTWTKCNRALVAGFARLRSCNVGRISSRSLGKGSVVASRAAGRDPHVVHRRARTPGREIRRNVAGLAGFRRWNVVGIRRLAQGVGSVVASGATHRNTNVVHRRTRTERREVRLGMARLTRLRRCNVCGISRLTKRLHTIMACRTTR